MAVPPECKENDLNDIKVRIETYARVIDGCMPLLLQGIVPYRRIDLGRRGRAEFLKYMLDGTTLSEENKSRLKSWLVGYKQLSDEYSTIVNESSESLRINPGKGTYDTGEMTNKLGELIGLTGELLGLRPDIMAQVEAVTPGISARFNPRLNMEIIPEFSEIYKGFGSGDGHNAHILSSVLANEIQTKFDINLTLDRVVGVEGEAWMTRMPGMFYVRKFSSASGVVADKTWGKSLEGKDQDNIS
jgi:hypothetical protein